MRTIRDIIGIIIAGFGFLFMFVFSWLFYGGIGSFLFGAILVMLGMFMSHRARHITCPSCYERIKYNDTKCRHCGHTFEGVPKDTLREPFYK
jgi:ribosomal protein L40E